MRFDELPLYEAVAETRREMESPGSDRWLLEGRDELCRAIQRHLPIGSPFTADQMMAAWVRFRKSPDGKLDLTIAVAKAHGKHCFFRNRGKGECSETVDLDRLIPESRGGRYVAENCVISCSFHNRQRNDRPLEDYLAPPG